MYLAERKLGQPDHSWHVIVRLVVFSPDHSLGLPESALQNYSSQALCQACEMRRGEGCLGRVQLGSSKLQLILMCSHDRKLLIKEMPEYK